MRAGMSLLTDSVEKVGKWIEQIGAHRQRRAMSDMKSAMHRRPDIGGRIG